MPAEQDEEMVGQMSSGGDALQSVALTNRFLTLCAHHGAEHLAVKMIAVGRNYGVPGLPASDDWTTWGADEMRAAVEYLEQMRFP